MDMHLRLLRSLIRRTDASKLLDLARPRFLIQTLGIPLLGFRDGDIDEDFDERERGVGGVFGDGGVEVAGELAVGGVGGDEGG